MRKASSHRVHKISNSLGVRAAFLYLQSHKWFDIGRPIKESLFQQIIREVNEKLSYELMNGSIIEFPKKMGCLEVRKHESYVAFKDGKLKTNYYIDWDKTLELWYNDAEARQNKTLVRDVNQKALFEILYNKSKADYNNKCYIQFKPHRVIKRIVSHGIKQGILDAYGYRGFYKN